MKPNKNPFKEIEQFFQMLPMNNPQNLVESSFPVDIIEEEDAVRVTGDLPGFSSDEIEVELDGYSLSIIATSEENINEEKDEYIRRERMSKTLSRTVRLPNYVDLDSVDASYNNGVLELFFEKDTESNSRTIEL